MAMKSSKSPWTSAMATTGSRGPAGAFGGPAHANTADTRTRRMEIQARWGASQTGGRTIFLPPMAKLQNFGENFAFRKASSIDHTQRHNRGAITGRLRELVAK